MTSTSILADQLSCLPDEILFEISIKLDLPSLLSLASVNSRWYEGIQGNGALWKLLCEMYEIQGKPQLPSQSWKDYFMLNYPKANYAQQWLGGKFSKVSSADDITSCPMFELDVETWGRILDMELSR